MTNINQIVQIELFVSKIVISYPPMNVNDDKTFYFNNNTFDIYYILAFNSMNTVLKEL